MARASAPPQKPDLRQQLLEPAVELMLRRARSGLSRLEPWQVPQALEEGAVLVDIRPEAQRERDGVIAAAVAICRNVLEWRCDPSSPWRDERVCAPARRLIILCDEGCQSSLAAATMQALGRTDATDVVGGFRAWREAELPVLAAVPR